MSFLSATARVATDLASTLTTKRSGVTRPETSASPSPHAASIIISASRPVCGFSVKRTPAQSAGTRRCTSTAIRPELERPMRRWYSSARLFRSDRKHSDTRARTSLAPTTFRYVSNWPANEVVAPSSIVAEDRTATGTPPPSLAYARSISAASSGESAPSSATAPPTASLVTQNPSGTGSPARSIAASRRAFPPTRGASSGEIRPGPAPVGSWRGEHASTRARESRRSGSARGVGGGADHRRVTRSSECRAVDRRARR